MEASRASYLAMWFRALDLAHAGELEGEAGGPVGPGAEVVDRERAAVAASGVGVVLR